MSHALVSTSPQPGALVLQHADNVAHFYAHWQNQAKNARDAYFGGCQSRLLAGYSLRLLRTNCAHGEFERLRKERFPELPDRTAQAWQKDAWTNCQANPELRKVTEALLVNREGEREQETFLAVANPFFEEQAKLRQMQDSATEMKLLNEPTVRKPASPARPAKKLTPGEQMELRRKAAEGDWNGVVTQLSGGGSSFVLLDDLSVNAQIALLERHLAGRKRWVTTPAKKRDGALVDEVEQLINPPVVTKAAKKKK